MKTIGFIGLGTIGGTIAKNFQLAGYPLMIYDIRAEAARTLADGGAQVAPAAAAVARQCPIILSSLPD